MIYHKACWDKVAFLLPKKHLLFSFSFFFSVSEVKVVHTEHFKSRDQALLVLYWASNPMLVKDLMRALEKNWNYSNLWNSSCLTGRDLSTLMQRHSPWKKATVPVFKKIPLFTEKKICHWKGIKCSRWFSSRQRLYKILFSTVTIWVGVYKNLFPLPG